MDVNQVLDRSRELVRKRGIEPLAAAEKAVDELAEKHVDSVDEISELRLCARYRDVLFGLDSYLICKSSRAQSFVVP